MGAVSVFMVKELPEPTPCLLKHNDKKQVHQPNPIKYRMFKAIVPGSPYWLVAALSMHHRALMAP